MCLEWAKLFFFSLPVCFSIFWIKCIAEKYYRGSYGDARCFFISALPFYCIPISTLNTSACVHFPVWIFRTNGFSVSFSGLHQHYIQTNVCTLARSSALNVLYIVPGACLFVRTPQIKTNKTAKYAQRLELQSKQNCLCIHTTERGQRKRNVFVILLFGRAFPWYVCI